MKYPPENTVLPDSIRKWRSRLEEGIDPVRVIDTATKIYESARWNSTEKLRELGGQLCEEMLVNGFDEAEVIEVPSDGVTHHGGWCMPLEWSPKSAQLEVKLPDGEIVLRADYADCPHHLVLFSAPTPKEGVFGELRILSESPEEEELSAIRGCFVLLEKAPSIELSQKIMRRGALGFVTDFVSRIPGVKEGPELENAIQYLNFNNAPWVIPEEERAVGFAISPKQGRRLREALESGQPLNAAAMVEVDLGPGSIPVITGLVKGRSDRNVILTSHIDEPGAIDNASGPAYILELARAVTSIEKQDGDSLEHGLRVFFSVEVRGLQALLNLQPALFKGGLFGMNIDMMGTDQREAKCPMHVSPSFPGNPDFVYPVTACALHDLSSKAESFQWEYTLMLDDNNTCDSFLKIPTLVFVQGPDATYHTSLDTPDRLDAQSIVEFGASLGALIAGLADANVHVVEKLLHLNYHYAVSCLKNEGSRLLESKPQNAVAQFKYLIRRERKRITSTLELDNSRPLPVPFVKDFTPKSAAMLTGSNRQDELRGIAHDLDSGMKKLGYKLLEAFPEENSPAPEAADRFVPKKAFVGHFTVDNLPHEHEQRIFDAAGPMNWCGPLWLQFALGLADGTKTVRDIHHGISAEQQDVELSVLLKTFEALEACSFVRRIPFLERNGLQSALRELGLGEGMLVVLHSSLSRFGYIEGGAGALLDVLSSILGESGTLCMPAHSLSWAGNEPYDAATSSSRVGAVSNAFRQHPGVIRSQHPTHSVAVQGPLADSLIAGHDKLCAPLGREGFWGHFVDNDGWVLLMCPRGSNTVMHAAEIWGGIKEPDVYLPTGDVLPQIPWHVDWFDEIYAVLDERGSIKSAPLGQSTIELMRAQEILEIGLELIRENPLRVCPDGCSCRWCQLVREENIPEKPL